MSHPTHHPPSLVGKGPELKRHAGKGWWALGHVAALNPTTGRVQRPPSCARLG